MAYIDHPTANGYYGGATAAPVVKKITQYILYKKKGFAQFAKYDEKSNKVNMDTVQSQQASTQKIFARGHMPDFTGLDKSSAIQLAIDRAIVIETNGFGVVTKQSIPAGTPFAGNSNLRLQFEAPTYAE